MSVQSGQILNKENLNAAFVSKIDDNTLSGSLTLSANLVVNSTSVFNENIDLASNTINGVAKLNGPYGTVFESSDEWLRINDDSTHSSGIYFGSSTVRTDGQLQVGSSGTTLAVVDGGAFNYRSGTLYAGTDGKVGIGTTGPSADLSVVAPAASDALVRVIAANYGTEYDARLYLGESDILGMTIEYDGDANVGYIGMNDSVDPTGAFSKRIQMSRTGTETSFMAGNIGIGIAAPDTLAHIYKDGLAAGNTDLLKIEGHIGDFATDPASIGMVFKYQDNNNPTNEARIKMATVNDTDFGDNDEAASNLIFSTTNGGVETDKMIITGRGDIGIGLLNPNEKLDVSGNIKVSGGVTINGGTSWHSNNDGPTSGLNADLLDGQHGTYYAARSNVLGLDQTTSFTPSADYHPSTKKYVDDGLATKSGTSHNHNLSDLSEKSYASLTGRPDLSLKADVSNVLTLDNTAVYTPSANYHPATKAYVDANSGSSSTVKREEFTATAGQTIFTITSGSYAPGDNKVSVYIWGIKQSNAAFTETNSTRITMASGLEAGDRVLIEWFEGDVSIQGDKGDAATLTLGAVSFLNPSETGYINNSGDINDAVYNFGIPKGSLVELNPSPVSVLNPDQNPTITDTGANGNRVLQFGIPRAPDASLGTVSTLTPDQNPSVTSSITSGDITLDFGIPRAADISLGTLTVLNPDQSPSVTDTGTSGDGVYNFSLPRASSVSVGTVTTLSSGQSATVSNTGTNGDIVLDFGIPRGTGITNIVDNQDGSITMYYGDSSSTVVEMNIDIDASVVSYDNSTSSMTATTVQTAIDEIDNILDNLSADAVDINYDNTTSGLTATNAQDAIDELKESGGSIDAVDELIADPVLRDADTLEGQAGSYYTNSSNIDYDNTTSGLTATDVKGAIDEIKGIINTPIKLETSSFTLDLGDVDYLIKCYSASSTTVNIPAESSINFPVGSEIALIKYGDGDVVFSPASGVDCYSANSALTISTKYEAVTLKKMGTDEWLLVGSLS